MDSRFVIKMRAAKTHGKKQAGVVSVPEAGPNEGNDEIELAQRV
jgi:hypothetical protein